MPNNRYTGKQMYINFGGTVVSGDWMQFDFERTADVIDVTAASDTDFVGLPGVQKGRWTLTVFDKASDGENIAQTLALGANGTLIFGPQGSAPGQPKFGFNAIVTGVQQRFAYDDTVIYTFEGIKSGPMLFDFGDVF